MPLRYTQRILDHLAHPGYRAVASEAMASDLRVDPEDLDLLDEAIQQLAAESRLEIASDGRVRLPSMPREITGRFRLHPKGFGFVVPDRVYREGDLFVPPGNRGSAITGDLVRAELTRRRGGHGDRPGRIVEVLQRGRTRFTGTLMRRGRTWFVHPDGRDLHEPVIVRDPHAKNAKVHDKIVFELIQWPSERISAEGVVTEVLGPAGEPGVETAAIIEAHELPGPFPEPVLDEAGRLARGDEVAPGPGVDREDLSSIQTFTIDPPDARDFDDAISIEHDGTRGTWTLGVHIADVSAFVRPGGALDAEARVRGTSVYLPRRVLPMLPEVLSNGVCSLQEGVRRSTKSVFITFDARGRVLEERVASTVIRSDARLTYLEAQAMIDGNLEIACRHARGGATYTEDLVEALQHCDRLARVLRTRRLRDGMIVLQLPEVELLFDDEGRVTDARPEDDAFTHTIIEMFMVEANEAVARLFSGLGIAVLRRIHSEPTFGDIESLRRLAASRGHGLPDEPTRHAIQALLDSVRDTPASRAIHFAVLRSLTRATYGPAMIGHYALASEHYAHFTSPIRRYPDLVLHRALEAFLEATANGRSVPGERERRAMRDRLLDDDRVLDEASLVILGRHCTDTEKRAEQAERELRSFLVLQFLHGHHLGDEFNAVVTGFSRGGIFLVLEQFLADGVATLADLPGSDRRADRWHESRDAGRITAQRSGAVISIGDELRVRIDSIDLASRRMVLTVLSTARPPRKVVSERSRRRR